MCIQLRANAADLTASLVRPRIGGLAEGSHVLTTAGLVAIENLQTGDEVITAQGDTVEIRAITRQSFDAIAPFCVAPGTFGRGKPAMEVKMAPGQHIYLRGWRAQALFGAEAALVPAWRLFDGQHVIEGRPQQLTTYELHFDTDAVIYVGGMEVGTGKAMSDVLEQVA